MTTPPASDRALVQRATGTLRRQILTGGRLPGQRLPPAEALAGELGIEPDHVEDVLGQLETLRLVVRAPDGAWRIADWRRIAEINLVPYYLIETPWGPEKAAMVEDLLLIRRDVLADAAARAAERASEAELDALAAIGEQMRASRGDTARLVELDLRFIMALVDATHSLPMRWMANSLLRLYGTFVRHYPNTWAITRDHFGFLDELLKSLRARDPDEVRAVVRAHFETSDAFVLSLVRRYAAR